MRKSWWKKFSLMLVVLTSMSLVSGFVSVAPANVVNSQGSVEATMPFVFENEQTQFTLGTFRRTISGPKVNLDLGSYPGRPDLSGAVQLMPVGGLDKFRPLTQPYTLPTKLSAMGTATFGNYIFLIGGDKRIDKSAPLSPDTVQTKEVWVGQVDQNTGMPTWKRATDIMSTTVFRYTNPKNPIDYIDYKADALSYPAVVAIPDRDDSSKGYVYVIGGLVVPSDLQADMSSGAVHIGRVENGVITSWRTGAMLPDPKNNSRTYGIHAATAQYYRDESHTRIYVFGGLQDYAVNDKTIADTTGSPYIFFADVGQDGKLYKPSDPKTEGWDLPKVKTLQGDEKDGQLPITSLVHNDTLGLWNSSSAVYFGVDSDGKEIGSFFYLFGGQRRKVGETDPVNQYTDTIYRAKIDPDSGKLDWSWGNKWTGSIGQKLINMSGMEYGGNVYLAGGEFPLEGKTSTVIHSNFIDENMQVGDVNGNSFAENDIKRERNLTGLSIVRSTNTTSSTLAFVYVMAGISGVMTNTGTTTQKGTDPGDEYSNKGTDTILFSRIDPTIDPVYPKTGGWYYSPLHDVTSLNDAQNKTTIRKLYWTAMVSRTAEITTDIQLEYRIDNRDLGCDDPQVMKRPDFSAWKPLTNTIGSSGPKMIYSQLGSNAVRIQEDDIQSKITCIQYRAKLTTNHEKVTPILMQVGYEAVVDKRPDLWVDKLAWTKNSEGMFTGVDVVIKNLYQNQPEKTYNANLGMPDPKTFYVDMYIFTAGQKDLNQMSPKATFPMVDGVQITPIDAAYNFYATPPRDIPPSQTFPTNPSDQSDWKWVDATSKGEDFQQVMEKLSTSAESTGTYTVCVVVDSNVDKKDEKKLNFATVGYVDEWVENNNIRCQSEVTKPAETKVCIASDQQKVKESDTTVKSSFIISRTTKDMSTPLDVSFTLQGTASISGTTASNPQDYDFDASPEVKLNSSKSVGTVTIPANVATLTFSFTPRNDTIQEEDETVTLRLNGTGNYQPYHASDSCRESATNTILNDDWYLYLPLTSKE